MKFNELLEQVYLHDEVQVDEGILKKYVLPAAALAAIGMGAGKSHHDLLKKAEEEQRNQSSISQIEEPVKVNKQKTVNTPSIKSTITSNYISKPFVEIGRAHV